MAAEETLKEKYILINYRYIEPLDNFENQAQLIRRVISSK